MNCTGFLYLYVIDIAVNRTRVHVADDGVHKSLFIIACQIPC